MSETVHPITAPEARQDTVELHSAARELINAEWVLFDFDDTLVQHDPQAQYWTALHTLALDHGGDFRANQFAHNYAMSRATKDDNEISEVRQYLDSIRDLSATNTGDPNAFERVAQAFVDHPHSGKMLKSALQTLPKYEKTGMFWEARAKLLRESGVPASFGKRLMPGMSSLLHHLEMMSKKMGVISNSRPDLIIPALDEMLPNGSATFEKVLALGGSGLPAKPAAKAYNVLASEHDIQPQSCVYIGNAYEDIQFGENAELPVLIIGNPFEQFPHAKYVEDVPALTKVLRHHTDGVGLLRIAATNAQTVHEPDRELTRSMTPDNIYSMVARGLVELWSRNIDQSAEAYDSALWAEDYVSLKNVENFADVFAPIGGDIRISDPIEHPQLAAYFTPERTYSAGDNSLSLRGPNYFFCVNQEQTPSDRINKMIDELRAAVATIESIDRRLLKSTDLLPYLGVLDNAKQQALSLFHAVTYEERRTGIDGSVMHLQLRKELLMVAKQSTRSFFEACVGREFTTPCSTSKVNSLVEQVRRVQPTVDPKGLKLQELDHPLKIMLSAYNFAKSHTFDTVVGFPCGGTQIAIATALTGEILQQRLAEEIAVVCIPLSQHSGTAKNGATPISDAQLDASVLMFRAELEGKQVMIVDDNSSTGSTINRGVGAIEKLNPIATYCGVGEIDPQRTLIRARQSTQNQIVEGVANMGHEVFSGASGVVPMSSNDVQLRKLYARRVLSTLN